jgi:hypothetical protein
MFDFICLICFIVTILVFWFQTNVFVEYCNLLKIKIPLNTSNLTYPQFLYNVYKNEKTLRSFLIKLITCPMCLGFWLCLLTGIPLFGIFSVFLLYISVCFIYFLFVRIIN